jgi:hypothetical protein
MSNITTIVCRDCGKDYSYEARRGRPAVRCPPCKEKAFPGSSVAGTLEDNSPSEKVAPKTSEKEEVVPSNNDNNEDVAPSSTRSIVAAEVVDDIVDCTFEVFVTNMGYVYRGENEKHAKDFYNRFVEKSKQGFGQVGNEHVSMYAKKVLICQHEPHPRNSPRIINETVIDLTAAIVPATETEMIQTIETATTEEKETIAS